MKFLVKIEGMAVTLLADGVQPISGAMVKLDGTFSFDPFGRLVFEPHVGSSISIKKIGVSTRPRPWRDVYACTAPPVQVNQYGASKRFSIA